MMCSRSPDKTFFVSMDDIHIDKTDLLSQCMQHRVTSSQFTAIINRLTIKTSPMALATSKFNLQLASLDACRKSTETSLQSWHKIFSQDTVGKSSYE